MNDIIKNIEDSSRDFLEIVWPQISEWFGDGEIIPVETVTDSKFCKLLDMMAGIDAWQIINNKGIRGIASRVQWGQNYKSWTIRRSKFSGSNTEWHRFLNMDKTLLKPSFFVQSYLDIKHGKLLGVGCIKIDDLIQMLRIKPVRDIKTNPIDNSTFIPIYWDEAKHNNYDVFIYNMPNLIHYYDKITTKQIRYRNA